MLLNFREVFLRELLAGSGAIETGAFWCSVVARGRAWLLLLLIFFFFTVFIFGCSMDGGYFLSIPFLLCVYVCVYASYLGFCYMHCAGHFCWDMAHPLSSMKTVK